MRWGTALGMLACALGTSGCMALGGLGAVPGIVVGALGPGSEAPVRRLPAYRPLPAPGFRAPVWPAPPGGFSPYWPRPSPLGPGLPRPPPGVEPYAELGPYYY